jgi:hypothetical protein
MVRLISLFVLGRAASTALRFSKKIHTAFESGEASGVGFDFTGPLPVAIRQLTLSRHPQNDLPAIFFPTSLIDI